MRRLPETACHTTNELAGNRSRDRMVRAQSHTIQGDREACERGVKAALSILPRHTSVRKGDITGLCRLAVNLGYERIQQLIAASAAVDFLRPPPSDYRPGDRTRVTKEVEELADDIRRDLKRYKKELGTD